MTPAVELSRRRARAGCCSGALTELSCRLPQRAAAGGACTRRPGRRALPLASFSVSQAVRNTPKAVDGREEGHKVVQGVEHAVAEQARQPIGPDLRRETARAGPDSGGARRQPAHSPPDQSAPGGRLGVPGEPALLLLARLLGGRRCRTGRGGAARPPPRAPPLTRCPARGRGRRAALRPGCYANAGELAASRARRVAPLAVATAAADAAVAPANETGGGAATRRARRRGRAAAAAGGAGACGGAPHVGAVPVREGRTRGD
eukprot:scaffold979_cov382-Prasinococcus_capsulatus_cf.AAC.10